MAHLEKLGGLTEELITLITSYSSTNDPTKFNGLRDVYLRSLRHHNYGRTNQFDVEVQMDGLVEKFSVHDKDALAEALNDRIHKLNKLETKWKPEILQLLLELSDRPVSNVKLDDLDHLKEPEPYPEPVLLWKDLRAEDPLLRDKHVWRNVDFTADSSEDEFEDTRSDISEPTTVESTIDEPVSHHVQVSPRTEESEKALADLRKAQFWLEAPSVGGVVLETVKKPITDLQAAREIMFMLSGLPTSLFDMLIEGSTIHPAARYVIKSISYETSLALLTDLAAIGSSLQLLRSWVKTSQTVPLLQSFQSQINKYVVDFESSIHKYQQRFVASSQDVVVSILDIRTYVDQLARSLVHLSTIVAQLSQERYPHAFRYLELLHDQACTSQLAGDDEIYRFMGTMFFDCLQLYLSPLRRWMEEGELDDAEKIFFISESASPINLASIWQSRYRLRRSQDGILHAPKFLLAATNRIFTTGKSVVMLKHLKQFTSPGLADKKHEPRLSFDNVCTPSLSFSPFAELFDDAFQGWVQSKHRHTSDRLQEILFSRCGLQKALDSLVKIYFMADGATAAEFAVHVFNKLDKLDDSWKDQYTLAEVARSSFGSMESVNEDHLRVKSARLPPKIQDPLNARRTVRSLSILSITYHLAWPIQIIIEPDTIVSYQRIFTFLFQVRRSAHMLTRNRLVKDALTHTSSSDERAFYHSLRIRLLWFTQTLYHYLTAIVLKVRTRKVKDDLRNAEDVDSMIAVHSAFIKMAIDQALLGSRLALIQKTILKILDLSIKLEDAQGVNAVATKQAAEQQREMMDRSMGSLGLHTPRKSQSEFSRSRATRKDTMDSDSDEDEQVIDADMSIFSSVDGMEELLFTERLRKMRNDFDAHIRFVASGLKGVARAGGGGEEAKSWDLLGEMLESGMRSHRDF